MLGEWSQRAGPRLGNTTGGACSVAFGLPIWTVGSWRVVVTAPPCAVIWKLRDQIFPTGSGTSHRRGDAVQFTHRMPTAATVPTTTSPEADSMPILTFRPHFQELLLRSSLNRRPISPVPSTSPFVLRIV